MKIARNDEGGERNNVAKLLDRLIILQPHKAGESVTRFSNGEPSGWVDCDAWFVAKDGTPTPIGSDGGTTLRVWSEVLVPTLTESVGETVAARIIRPGTAYLFDELDDAEIARCEKAEKTLAEGAFLMARAKRKHYTLAKLEEAKNDRQLLKVDRALRQAKQPTLFETERAS